MKKLWIFVKNNCLILLAPILLSVILFKDFVFRGLWPIPADILVGSFHPWFDETWLGRTLGYPVKNIETCDVVYQLFPWKLFSIREFIEGRIPLWNPHNLTGTPHLANIFTASLYPLNFIFLVLPFVDVWGLYIFIQPLLISLTTYFYLRNLKLTKESSLFGGIVFAFSSIIMMRLEFGMVGHAALWLPLALLAVDKTLEKKDSRWLLLGVFSLSANFLAGYLQVAIYSFMLYGLYCLFRLIQKKDFANGFTLLFAPVLALMVSGVQLLPLLEIVLNSSRLGNYGRVNFFGNQFFLPWHRLITFLIPDFFGNYATWNFWGELSYYEFAGYIGIVPLFFVFYSLFSRRRNKELSFWLIMLIGAFLFLLKTPLALLPYQLKIPGFSVLVPARLIYLVDFSLAILAAFGLDVFQRHCREDIKKASFPAFSLLVIIFAVIAIILIRGAIFWPKWQENLMITLRNGAFPTLSLSFLFASLIYCCGLRSSRIKHFFVIILIFASGFELVRHAQKYNSFVDKEVIFPRSKVIDYLVEQKKEEPFRVQVLNQNLFPANTNIVYGLDFINGYDSFNSRRLKKLLTVANFEDPDADLSIFKRSVFLTNHRSPLFDLMNTKYVLSLDEMRDPKLELVFTEGKTKVYKNKKSYPRAYFAADFKIIEDEGELLTEMIRFSRAGERRVILEEEIGIKKLSGVSSQSLLEIIDYFPQGVKIKTKSANAEILVLSDAYDPGWRATIDNQPTKVFRANHNFRAILVPAGEHSISFFYRPRMFTAGFHLSAATISLLLFGLIISSKKAK